MHGGDKNSICATALRSSGSAWYGMLEALRAPRTREHTCEILFIAGEQKKRAKEGYADVRHNGVASSRFIADRICADARYSAEYDFFCLRLFCFKGRRDAFDNALKCNRDTDDCRA